MAALTLRGKALAWLAQREHSRLELQQKLQRYAQKVEANLEDIPAVLDALEAAGHLSRARFIESRVNARLARFGNRRIEQELRAKGVAADDALRAQLRDSELARAQRVFETKFGPGCPLSPSPGSLTEAEASAQLRARQARFLAARGFSAETVSQVLRRAHHPEKSIDPLPLGDEDDPL